MLSGDGQELAISRLAGLAQVIAFFVSLLSTIVVSNFPLRSFVIFILTGAGDEMMNVGGVGQFLDRFGFWCLFGGLVRTNLVGGGSRIESFVCDSRFCFIWLSWFLYQLLFVSFDVVAWR